ncbi:MAG: hypothetical protein SGPRY_008867, partial [Prymnesium sp.]
SEEEAKFLWADQHIGEEEDSQHEHEQTEQQQRDERLPPLSRAEAIAPSRKHPPKAVLRFAVWPARPVKREAGFLDRGKHRGSASLPAKWATEWRVYAWPD